MSSAKARADPFAKHVTSDRNNNPVYSVTIPAFQMKNQAQRIKQLVGVGERI
jgi:hypothetical protein